jgi:protein involved in polysaccharide export with SLBB domain
VIVIRPHHRIRAALAALLIFAVTLSACGPGANNADLHLAPPQESNTVGPGDVFTLTIVGESGIPTEYQVRHDGNVMLPYLKNLHVEGMDPEQIEELIRTRLMDEKFLQDPIVIVRMKQYNSKQITILGQVARPGSFPYSGGMTMIQAISMAGGFNSIARRGQVSLRRKLKKGDKTVTRAVVVNVDSIIEGESQDVLLQAGDAIYVPERVF